jgi:hypothetical protein
MHIARILPSPTSHHHACLSSLVFGSPLRLSQTASDERSLVRLVVGDSVLILLCTQVGASNSRLDQIRGSILKVQQLLGCTLLSTTSGGRVVLSIQEHLEVRVHTRPYELRLR